MLKFINEWKKCRISITKNTFSISKRKSQEIFMILLSWCLFTTKLLKKWVKRHILLHNSGKSIFFCLPVLVDRLIYDSQVLQVWVQSQKNFRLKKNCTRNRSSWTTKQFMSIVYFVFLPDYLSWQLWHCLTISNAYDLIVTPYVNY